MRVSSIAALCRRLHGDQRGTIVIMAAALLPVVLAAAALAIDLGALYVERRQAQGAADLAAIAAAADLDKADAAVKATLAANGITDAKVLKVTKGHYQPDPKIPPAQRFAPGVTPFNAVQVDLTRPGRLYFAHAFLAPQVDLGVRAVAANASLATFSVGSRLLSVNDGLLNQILGGLVGGNVSLKVMDYEALLNADVKINGLLDTLATDLKLTGGTYTDVLNANMKVGDVLGAAAKVAGKQGNGSAASALTDLSSQVGSTALKVPLSSIIDLGPYGSAAVGQSNPGLDAGINLLDLVNGTASLANGTNQVALNLGATVPGLVSLKIDLAIGERPQQSPWVKVGQAGSTVYTAQTRLRIVAEIGGTGALAGAVIRLPIGIDLAYAQATLASATCSSGDPNTAKATIATKPGIAKAWIGETSLSGFTDFKSAPSVTSANIVNAGLIKVTGSAEVAVTNVADIMLQFTYADIAAKTIKTAETVNFAETLVSSLVQNLNLKVTVGGIGIGLPATVKTLVASTLAGVAAPLDAVVHSLLNTLGVHLGEADVRLHGIRCGAAVLAG